MRPRSSATDSHTHRSHGRRLKRERMHMVRVDVPTLLWHLQRSSLSRTAFADRMGIGRTVLYRMLAGNEVKHSTARDLADALKVPVETLLESTPVASSPEEVVSPWKHPEWQIVPGTLEPLRVMSNGLVMRVAKVRHRVLENEFGRAKLYDILGMPAVVRRQCRETLVRHAVVCRLLAECPFIARNLTLTALEDEGIWTSVDAWCEGCTLAKELAAGSLPLHRVRAVMTQVGSGIAALHAEQIVLRELHPESILIRAVDQACQLTDLELAKLLEVEATVSSNWQTNPYRAPEVAGGQARPQADIYSAARLLVRLLIGDLPNYPDDIHALEVVLPESPLLRLLRSGLSPNWRKRPASIDDLLAFLPELEVQHG